jgi:hypothetical protein
MSKLTSADYNNILNLINAVYATPNVPGVIRNKAGTGYSCSNIILSYRLLYPESTLTDDQICSLLSRGSRSGVFTTTCAGSTDPDVSTCSTGLALYFVNNSMVRVNPTNKIYAVAFNGLIPPPPVPIYNPLVDSIPAISYAAFVTTGFSNGSGNC